MSVLWRTSPDERDHPLRMLGWPAAAWHLELVQDPQLRPSPTEEDLLVLYLDGRPDDTVVQRLCDAGGTRVPARNPYWDQCGVTVEDPDGYRVVLSSGSWGTRP